MYSNEYQQNPNMYGNSAMDGNGECKCLYVGNLDPKITDTMLLDVFRISGVCVINVKIMSNASVSLIPLIMHLFLFVLDTGGKQLCVC